MVRRKAVLSTKNKRPVILSKKTGRKEKRPDSTQVNKSMKLTCAAYFDVIENLHDVKQD